MTRFRYSDESVLLNLGERWAAQPSGESYRDTAAENVRGIIQEVQKGVPWRDAIATRYAKDNPWLYRIITSESRTLFFRQHPPAAGGAVLDIGAGWGQIALPLAREPSVTVTALEPTPERLTFIETAAAQEGIAERMNFIQADFLDLDFEPAFDLVSCVGVLEWVPKFHPGDPQALQVDFLRRIRSVLRPGGKCYVGIENRFGLKYLLGGRDDHTGRRNVSVFDSRLAVAKHRAVAGEELRVFTHTDAEYATLFQAAGFSQIEAFASFPDYKLPELILPVDPPADFNRALLGAQIPAEHDGVEGQPLPDPEDFASHYRSLAQMGVAHHFSPSFYFVLQ